jgi:hypothetical protein
MKVKGQQKHDTSISDKESSRQTPLIQFAYQYLSDLPFQPTNTPLTQKKETEIAYNPDS